MTITNDNRTPPSWAMLAAIVCFSILTVYTTYVSIYTKDVRTGAVYREDSLTQYHQGLDGTRAFPYRWRLLGIYIVFAGEKLTGLDPHAVDVVVKAAFLACSSTILFLFARAYATDIGAFAATALYLVATAAGFTDGYSIYYTNDYVMIAAWFAIVWLARARRYAAVALLTFIGGFAKETMLLAPVLTGLSFLRKRAGWGAVVLVGVAFVVPVAFLRIVYPAPLRQWAWWDMVFANVPFLQSTRYEFMLTMKNNLKVLMLYNVLWFVAARAIARSKDAFLRDLGLTSIVYLVLAYPVIYFRELRHFLPLAIVVLPAAIGALEGSIQSSAATTATAMKTKTNG